MIPLGELNLDGLAVEEVEAVAAALVTLTAYAKLKAQAMRWRAQGGVTAALRSEARCEELYRQLPESWRW